MFNAVIVSIIIINFILISSIIFFCSFFKYRYILFLILQAEYCNANRTTWKLTFNTSPKKLKTERDCSHIEQFRYYCSVSIWSNNRWKLWCKISAHSDLSPNPELSTPTESRRIVCPLEGNSPRVKLVSHKKKIKKSYNNNETDVYSYNPALFWVLLVACWCLRKLIFT